uniref:Uncharacterized protein n=1 Tax=Romanomermis culicivorax TaxID=13658 RepID=A0A915L6N4_ROMCU
MEYLMETMSKILDWTKSHRAEVKSQKGILLHCEKRVTMELIDFFDRLDNIDNIDGDEEEALKPVMRSMRRTNAFELYDDKQFYT